MLHQAHLIVALALAAAEPAAVPSSPAPGAAASAFAPVTDKTFASVALAPHKGKIVVVNFWASYCAPCLDEIPMFSRVLAAEKDLALVFVSADAPQTAERARQILLKRKITIPSLLVQNEDPEPFIRAVDPGWSGQVPYTVFYGPTGNVLFALDGEQSEGELRAAIAKAKAGPTKP